MAKKTKKIEVIDPEKSGLLIKQPIGDVMHTSMMPYSEYVILERALPRIEDGLKPVQRRILYTMWELKLDPDKPYKKSARVVGDTLGKYHPHGDTSVYDAMVRLAQNFNMGECLVDGHGNFGSVDGDGAAAMRYTEVRMSEISLEMLRDIDKETVQFKYNFDDTLKEPEILPSRFPNLLVNGASGIAVGFATEIPTHNLGETIDACIYGLKKPAATSKDFMQFIPAPDFPTGGLIMKDLSELDKIYDTGKGKVVIRAKTTVESVSATKNAIVITEFPFQLNKAKTLEKIAQLCEDKKSVLANVVAIRDESDKSGIRAVIEIKKDADPEKILAYLYKYSDLQYNYNVNMVAVADGKPVRLSLSDCIHHYVDFQKDVVTKKTKYELDKALADKHIQEGLIKACSIIDQVIATIRASKSPADARENLMNKFGFSREQAQAILDLKLQRLTNLEIMSLRAYYSDLCARIAEYEKILASDDELKRVIIEDLSEIKAKYAHPRKSEIVSTKQEKTFTEDEFVVSEDVIVVITHNQEVKSIEKNHFNRSNGTFEEIDVGKGDYIEHIFHTSTDNKIVLFTNRGNSYLMNIANIPTSKWKERGVPITNLMPGFDRSEKIIGTFVSKNFNDGNVLFVTKKGMCKLTDSNAFLTSRTKIGAFEVDDDDTLIYAKLTNNATEVVFVSENGMALKTEVSQISVMGRASKGVKAMKLKDKDTLCGVCLLKPKSFITIMSDVAYAKRVPASQITLQKRAGVGISAFKFNKNGSNGNKIIFARATNDLEEKYLILKEDGSSEFVVAKDISDLPLTSAGKSISDWHEELAGCIYINQYNTRPIE